MRPYFETKVVKVRKPETEVIKFTGKKYEIFIKDGKVSIRRHKHQAECKGNWVNGENLDKIKFPCFCSYDNSGKKSYGEINKNLDDFINEEFIISGITKQTKGLSVRYGYHSLKEMVEERHIKILKGKIILFEEE
ncbi:MAG: hypothetical protein E3J83_04220 [Candidatus Atribacteria bacterium]|nr:MAG: hypothetical protein E3J83_04220 [Candidatus Atribacteria bacterium]